MTLAVAPLAERMRPRTIDEVIGQRHLLGPGRPLRVAFETRQPHSCILWGPPGVGKTTLARLMAQAFDAQFVSISAVLGGVKDIREAVEQAERARTGLLARRTIVFVDEVHRFNKGQQDAFLPHVESGLFTFVGATTENPSFEVNSALLSRAVVHVLRPLDLEDMQCIAETAARHVQLPSMDDAAMRQVLLHADGDARRLINALERVAAVARQENVSSVGADWLQRVLGDSWRRFDKGGDLFHDSISALHKAVRGSDPDAALYWFARMLDSGADPRYLARRLVRMASEDIGLADPRALQLAMDAAQVYERLGSPEGELALAQAVVYLAVASKSNAVYMAYKAARELVQSEGTRPVPMHLRNAPTALMKTLGHGRDYRYAHDEPDAYAAGECYWPDGMPARQLYAPTDRGLESRIAQRLSELRARDAHHHALSLAKPVDAPAPTPESGSAQG